MSKTYCGACRGERGCVGCVAVGKTATYTAFAGFYADGISQDVSAKEVNAVANFAEVTCGKEIFLAADLGTTTLAFVCADKDGKILASFGCENPQRMVAADVIGRIDAALHGQRECLTNEIREALVKGFLFVLNRGMECFFAETAESVDLRVTVGIAGNTAMQHLLLDYPIDDMAKAPFTPHTTKKAVVLFEELFSDTTEYGEVPLCLRNAKVTVFPCLSAFVGGDIVAGANAVFSERTERVEMLIDLGTNGELLLSVNGKWYGTAAAMGSAIEGGRYAYATELFHKIADVLKQGIADETGLLCEPYFTDGYKGLLQEDIRDFQLAKGAVRAGIELLCRDAEIKPEEVERVYLAGGLGSYCTQEDLFRTGLLPKQFFGKVKVVGNSCIGGILSCLKNDGSMIYCEGDMINLAEQPEFEELYYRFMNFEENGLFGED